MTKKITHEGVLRLGEGNEIPCYVLEDGTRVLAGRQMQRALKMVDENEKGKQESGARLTRYLNQKTLNPFIFRNVEQGHFAPINCETKGGLKVNGYEATTLVDICDGFLEARKHINLSPRQKIIAEQCEILVRSFAKIGIISLIDEATGYQYEREKHELQAILQLFISKEILDWKRIFELSFYKEIFRLWNIPFTAQNIRKKPMFIGRLTNDLVYKNMPKGTVILEKLKEKTPLTKGGNYRYRLHQSLTKDAGREALKKIVQSVETLASISETKEQFKSLMEQKFGDKDKQLKLLFEELDIVETPKIINPTNFDKQLKGLLAVPPPRKEENK